LWRTAPDMLADIPPPAETRGLDRNYRGEFLVVILVGRLAIVKISNDN